jgi:hypothetical protein
MQTDVITLETQRNSLTHEAPQPLVSDYKCYQQLTRLAKECSEPGTELKDDFSSLIIGCKDRGSAIDTAKKYPKAQFTIVDTHVESVLMARKHARKHALPNLKFLTFNINEITRDIPGEFDFIIADGFLGGASPTAQKKLLSLIESGLKQQGIASLSYFPIPQANDELLLLQIIKSTMATLNSPLEIQAREAIQRVLINKRLGAQQFKNRPDLGRLLEELSLRDASWLQEAFGNRDFVGCYPHELVADMAGISMMQISETIAPKRAPKQSGLVSENYEVVDSSFLGIGLAWSAFLKK